VRIPGEHNLENALAATAMALALGADPAAVRYGLATFEGVEHRIEFVAEVDGVGSSTIPRGPIPTPLSARCRPWGFRPS
jgi:UDP-N-acetylmuramoylalanine--D-glutamate ligase